MAMRLANAAGYWMPRIAVQRAASLRSPMKRGMTP